MTKNIVEAYLAMFPLTPAIATAETGQQRVVREVRTLFPDATEHEAKSLRWVWKDVIFPLVYGRGNLPFPSFEEWLHSHGQLHLDYFRQERANPDRTDNTLENP